MTSLKCLVAEVKGKFKILGFSDFGGGGDAHDMGGMGGFPGFGGHSHGGGSSRRTKKSSGEPRQQYTFKFG